MTNKSLGQSLRRLRKERGFSQKCIAQRLSMSRQKYARIEKGINDVTISVLEILADVYGIPVSVIMELAHSDDQLFNGENKNDIASIADMLDFFYANKHIYERMHINEYA
ncbi:MAG: helix-turn-helix domain-containing protein [Schwartzia sp.]|nr:helix-turn-helix domain-containing protein [Schwartzia sp. (in: firmicutes)]